MKKFVLLSIFIGLLGSSLLAQPLAEVCEQNDRKTHSRKVLKLSQQCTKVEGVMRKYEYDLLNYCGLPGSSIALSTTRKSNDDSHCKNPNTLELSITDPVSSEVACAKRDKDNIELVSGDGSDRLQYVLRKYNSTYKERTSFCTHKSKLNSEAESYLVSLAEFNGMGEVAKQEYYPRHCLVTETSKWISSSKKIFCLILNGAKCHSSKNHLDHSRLVHSNSIKKDRKKELKKVLKHYLKSTGTLAETATETLFKKNPEIRPSLAKVFSPEGGESYLSQVEFPTSGDWEKLVGKSELVGFLDSFYQKCSKLFPNAALDSMPNSNRKAQ